MRILRPFLQKGAHMLQCFCGQRSKSTTITNGETNSDIALWLPSHGFHLEKKHNAWGVLEGLKWGRGSGWRVCVCVFSWPLLCVSQKSSESAVSRASPCCAAARQHRAALLRSWLRLLYPLYVADALVLHPSRSGRRKKNPWTMRG